jgi:hypothetical protein
MKFALRTQSAAATVTTAAYISLAARTGAWLLLRGVASEGAALSDAVRSLNPSSSDQSAAVHANKFLMGE